MRVAPLLAAFAAFLPMSAAAEPPMLSQKPVAIISQATLSPSQSPATAATAVDAKPTPVIVARPQPPSLTAKINLSTQRLELYGSGGVKESWAISSGREEFPTPRGVFRPQWASKMWFSRKYDNAPMPHAVFFSGGAAVHATQATGMLGQPASHGCVRLAPAHAARFYDLVHKHGYANTRIEVFGTPPPTRVARRSAPVIARSAGAVPVALAAGAWGGWSQPNGSAQPWAGHPQQVALRRTANGVVHLPPGSPHRGAQSFVHNGVTYVRVR